MKLKKIFYLVFGACIAVCGCASQGAQWSHAGYKSLNQKDLELLFLNERSVEFFSSGRRFNVRYFSNGRQEIDWGDGRDEGRFRIKNEEFCSTWTRLRNGTEYCSKIYQINKSEFEFRSSDDTSHAIMRLK